MTESASCKMRYEPVLKGHYYQRNSSPANISKYENSFVVEMLVPGIRMEDIEIKLDDNLLSVMATSEAGTEKKNYLKREFNYTGFKRNFRIGQKIDEDAITAKLTAGILRIELPIRADKLKRKISII